MIIDFHTHFFPKNLFKAIWKWFDDYGWGIQHKNFADEFFDLIVWFDEAGTIIGFQLCYEPEYEQRALTWRRDFGYSHHRVDDGEHYPGKMKSTPILVADGLFDRGDIGVKFANSSSTIDREISRFVLKQLSEYPEANRDAEQERYSEGSTGVN